MFALAYKRYLTYAWFLFLVVGACAAGFYFTLPADSLAMKTLDFLFPLAAVTGIIFGVRMHRPERTRPWTLFAIGMTFFVINNLARLTYKVFYDSELPAAYPDDISQTFGYVLIIAALVSLIYSRKGGDSDRSSLIDATIVVVGASMLSWVFLIAPFAHDTTLPLSERLFGMAYPLADLILLGVSVRLAVSRGARTVAFSLLLLAMVASLVSNTAVLEVITQQGVVAPDSPVNIGFLLAYVFSGAATLHPSMRSLTEVGHHETSFTKGRLGAFLLASLAGPGAYAIETARGRDVDVGVLLSGSLAIFILVLFRMAGLAKTLHERETSSRLLFESSPLPMWVYDAETLAFLEVNDAAVEHYGWSRHEFLTMTIAEIRPPEEVPALLANIEENRDDYQASGPWRHCKKSGGIIDVEVASHLIDLANREAVLVVALDVTARNRISEEKEALERQLRQSQKLEAVGQLAGGVAHDFNNLLAVILNYARFVRQDVDGTPSAEDADQILSATNKAANLVRQLLAFSRREIIKPAVLDLNHVVSEMERMLRRTIKESILLVVELEPELWRTEVDPGHLEQVILNLAVNADAAMPEGGRLQIHTANRSIDETIAAQRPGLSPGDYVFLSVSDDGVGMSKDVAAHVFEPFFTTKAVGEGTGLGLSTAYGIVKQAGGHISVYSEPGKGTSFNIYLPATTAEVGIERVSLPPVTDHRGTETVLVVEDESGVRDIARRLLINAGYTVIVSESPLDALELFEEDPPHVDLLLTDVIMPGLSGRQLALRLDQKLPGLPTIYMSGYTDEIIAHQGILEPGVAYLQKPFGEEDLLPLVREVLDKTGERSALAGMATNGNGNGNGNGKGKGIVIVDDEGPMREVLRLLLEAHHYRVLGEAADGAAAIELARELHPDVVILDHMMPGMDGASAAPLLRAVSPSSRIVAFSAILSESPEWADGFLAKERIGELPPLLAKLGF